MKSEKYPNMERRRGITKRAGAVHGRDAGRLLTGSQGRATALVVKGKLLKFHVAGESERDPVRWQHC